MTRLNAVARALTPVLILMLAAATNAAEAPEEPGRAPGLNIRAIDKVTQQPLAGAKLEIMLTGRESERQTDAAGTAHVALRVQDPAWLGITVSKEGYVSKRVDWRGYRLGQMVPETQVFELERGITIGGVVHDTAGKPVGDVELSVSIFGFGKSGEVEDHMSDLRVTTDPDGRWSCDGTPADISTLNISFMRPQTLAYSATGAGLPTGESVGPAGKETLEPFRRRSAVLVRPDVLRVPGTVVGPDDKPVAGADVSSYARKGQQFTGADGRFVVDVPASTVFGFIVRAPGFAREVVRLERMSPGEPEPIVVKLRQGATVRGRVVDTAGKPVDGANIDEATTDAQGRFTIADMPEGSPNVSIQAEGFLEVRQQIVRTGGDENLITLRRPAHVTGNVVDAETLEPVESFKVVPGTRRSAGQPMNTARDMTGAFTGGKFDANFHDPLYAFQVDGRVLRVEADGYVPAVSPVIPVEKEAFRFDVKLTRGKGPAGVVLGVDRKPLAGVKVYLSTPEEVVYVTDGKVVGPAEPVSTTSDAEGRFELAPQVGPYAVVVTHESGFIMKTHDQLKGNPQMLLMPWGRVEGVVKVGGKPAAGETMELDYRNSLYSDRGTVYFYDAPVKTDAKGHYAFTHVAPIPAKLGRRMRSDDPARPAPRRPTHQENVNVHPGETLTVNIGATGVPLVGWVKPPADLAGRAAQWTYGDLSELRLVLPAMPVPANFSNMPDEEQGKWVQAYLESPEGKKLDRENFKRGRFPVDVRPDGSFRVDDLPPGFYSLALRALDPSKRSANSLGEEVAKATRQFVIPEQLAGKQFDLGELTVEPLFNLPVGRAVPDFAVKTLDGRPIELSDYRGKVVLLDFWATWCGPCIGDTPALKAVHEAFGDDDRFVLISLSLDPDPQPAVNYVKKNGLNWVHGFLGEWSKTQLPDQFGVRGIPAYFLIGPDGKLITRDLSGNNLKREVEAALQKLPAKPE